MRLAVIIGMLMILGLTQCIVPVRAAASAEEAYNTAKQLLDTGNDQQAVDAFTKYLADYPNDVNALSATYNLGCGYANLEKFLQALAAFATVVNKATSVEQMKLRAEAYFQTADCQARLKAYDKAADAYQACLKLLTKDDADLQAQAEYWLGDALTQEGGHEQEALAAYAKVPEIDAKHALAPWSFYARGSLALRRRDYRSAVDLLEKVITDYPQSDVITGTKMALGLAEVNLGLTEQDEAARARDYQQAEPLLTAVQNDDKAEQAVRRQATLTLAQLYGAEKKFDLADAAYTRALLGLDANDPAVMTIHFDRANMLFNADRYADAATEYALVMNGKDSASSHEAAYWLGNCRYQLAKTSHDRADYARAITAFARYLTGVKADDVHGARAQLLLAYSQEDAGGLGDDAARLAAIASYTQLQAQWPQSPEAAEVSNGLLRVTAAMKPADLAKILPTLPEGLARWNTSLQIARQSYLNNQNQQVVDDMRALLKKTLPDELFAQANYLLGAAELRLEGHAADAIPALEQAQAKAGTDDLRVLAAQGLTQAYLDTAQYPLAIASARKLMQLPLSATDPLAREKEKALRWELLGRAEAGAKDYAQVIAAYQHLIDECPQSSDLPNALFACGWAAEGMKEPARAETYYRKLMTDYPTAEATPGATLRLAALRALNANYQEVIDLLAKFSLTASPEEQAEAAYDVAAAYAGLGKDAEANTRFSAVAEKFPTSPFAGESLAREGEYQMRGQHYPEAKTDFARALALLPANSPFLPLLHYDIGACDLRTDAYAESVKEFDTVLTKYPISDSAGDSLYWKGQALELQGKAKATEARAAYQQYLADYPAGPCALDAALGAGRAALLGEQYDAAKSDLTKAIDLCKRADLSATLAIRAKNVLPEAYYHLGRCLYAQKNYAEALTTYARIANCNLEPWYSRSLLEMARCSALAGDKTAAQHTLQLLQKNFPQSDAAKQAPQVAEELKIELK